MAYGKSLFLDKHGRRRQSPRIEDPAWLRKRPGGLSNVFICVYYIAKNWTRQLLKTRGLERHEAWRWRPGARRRSCRLGLSRFFKAADAAL
jgi:hypothetical protein